MQCSGAPFGVEVCEHALNLYRGRDFKDGATHTDVTTGAEAPFPPGQLFFEFDVKPTPVRWPWVIAGSRASIKVESEEVEKIPARTRFQLVWLPDGEVAGGDPLAFGFVRRLG